MLVIASETRQCRGLGWGRWIASSQRLHAMTVGANILQRRVASVSR
jgi:hypothetical protein